MRDSKGRFIGGNTFGKGRPKGSGKKHVKEMTWQSLERVVRLLFTMPDEELVRWTKENRRELSRAEKVFLETGNVKKLDHLNSLLDRIIGKPTYATEDTGEEDDELDEALALLEAEEDGIPISEARENASHPIEDGPPPIEENDFLQLKTEKRVSSIKKKSRTKAKRNGKRKGRNNVRRKK